VGGGAISSPSDRGGQRPHQSPKFGVFESLESVVLASCLLMDSALGAQITVYVEETFFSGERCGELASHVNIPV
jgi:hypothetical protein